MKQSSAKIYDKEMAHVMSAKELFGVEKPIIALLHLRALPGDPAYNKAGGLNYIIDTAAAELRALQDGGVDAVLFANEYKIGRAHV